MGSEMCIRDRLYKESIDPEEILMSKVSSNPASLRLLQMIKDLITKNSVDDY